MPTQVRRTCDGCGKPLPRWRRGCFHGIYTAITPYEWERKLLSKIGRRRWVLNADGEWVRTERGG